MAPYDPNLHLIAGTPVNRRRTGRHRCRGARSDLGRVLDISGGGVGIGWRGLVPPKVREVRPVRLQCAAGAMVVRARVVRSDPAGMLQRRLGLSFEGLDAGRQRALAAFIRHATGPGAGVRRSA